MLRQMINNRVEFLTNINSWEEAVNKGADPLLRDGFIKKSYIDSMIEDINKNGPYIVLTDGVAMPHTRPENGALKTGMSFLKVEHGVMFLDTEVPVTLLFTLVASNTEEHIAAIMQLADLLGNDESLERLKKVTSKEELFEIIS
ncbi:MAG: PTS sugar transporter subunit IIA [Brevinema sp.]